MVVNKVNLDEIIQSIRELASSFCSNSEEIRREVSSLSDGVGKMRNSLRNELSHTEENEQLGKIDQLQEALFAELESIRHIVADPVGKRAMKTNYKQLKSTLDRLITHNKQLSVLVQDDIDLLNQVSNINQFFADEIQSVEAFLELMKYRMNKCQLFETRYFDYLSWITELDLELTNICHLSTVSHSEKLFRLTEIKINAEENAPSLEDLKDLANELLEFLERDVERAEVKSQMETLLTLSVIIFETLKKNTYQQSSNSEEELELEDDDEFALDDRKRQFQRRDMKQVLSTPINQSTSTSTKLQRDNSLQKLNFSPIKSNDDDDRSSNNSSFGFEWDTSDFIRDIDVHMDNDEEAPIPLISPLETAASPLEKFIEDGRTKVESVEYLNRCETPKYYKLCAFNESYRSFIDRADGAVDAVHQQLLYPSILDGSWKDQGQALINRWQDIKMAATKRADLLDDKYDEAQSFLSDVNDAIEWLNQNKFFDRMHSLHDDGVDNTENQTDTEKTADKSLKRVQNEIMMLKQLVSESKEKEPVIINMNIQLENPNICADPAVRERIQELREDWTEFSKGLNGWKTKIESDIRRSTEYETVIARAETVVVDLHKKKQQCCSKEDITELSDELRTLRSRVEALENMATELNHISTPHESCDENSFAGSVDSEEKHVVGFQTLRIIKNICDRELLDHDDEHSTNSLASETLDNDMLEIDEESDTYEPSTILEEQPQMPSVRTNQIVPSEPKLHKRNRVKILCATIILSYPAFVYLLPSIAFLYSVIHCQAPDPSECPMEKLRHPTFHLTWPNGPPPC